MYIVEALKKVNKGGGHTNVPRKKLLEMSRKTARMKRNVTLTLTHHSLCEIPVNSISSALTLGASEDYFVYKLYTYCYPELKKSALIFIFFFFLLLIFQLEDIQFCSI